MKIAFTIPGFPNIDINLPTGVPTGGLFPTGQNIISVGIQLLIMFAVLLSLFFMGRAGFNIITSGGDKERVAKGRERLRYAIFGLLVIFLSVAFISLLSAFFGVNLLGSQ